MKKERKVVWTAHTEVNGFLFPLEEETIPYKDLEGYFVGAVDYHLGKKMTKKDVERFLRTKERRIADKGAKDTYYCYNYDFI